MDDFTVTSSKDWLGRETYHVTSAGTSTDSESLVGTLVGAAITAPVGLALYARQKNEEHQEQIRQAKEQISGYVRFLLAAIQSTIQITTEIADFTEYNRFFYTLYPYYQQYIHQEVVAFYLKQCGNKIIDTLFPNTLFPNLTSKENFNKDKLEIYQNLKMIESFSGEQRAFYQNAARHVQHAECTDEIENAIFKLSVVFDYTMFKQLIFSYFDHVLKTDALFPSAFGFLHQFSLDSYRPQDIQMILQEYQGYLYNQAEHRVEHDHLAAYRCIQFLSSMSPNDFVLNSLLRLAQESPDKFRVHLRAAIQNRLTK